MERKIKKVAVLGSGVMGATIAAHLANVGIPSIMLDIVPPKLTPEEEKKGLTFKDAAVRNRFAATGKQNLLRMRPAALAVPEFAGLIEVGELRRPSLPPGGSGLDHRSGGGEPEDQAGALQEGGGRAQARDDHQHQHLRDSPQRHRRGHGPGVQTALPGDPLLQPPAVHETPGDHHPAGDPSRGGGIHGPSSGRRSWAKGSSTPRIRPTSSPTGSGSSGCST